MVPTWTYALLFLCGVLRPSAVALTVLAAGVRGGPHGLLCRPKSVAPSKGDSSMVTISALQGSGSL